jgi:hypothetical protein
MAMERGSGGDREKRKTLNEMLGVLSAYLLD